MRGGQAREKISRRIELWQTAGCVWRRQLAVGLLKLVRGMTSQSLCPARDCFTCMLTFTFISTVCSAVSKLFTPYKKKGHASSCAGNERRQPEFARAARVARRVVARPRDHRPMASEDLFGRQLECCRQQQQQQRQLPRGRAARPHLALSCLFGLGLAGLGVVATRTQPRSLRQEATCTLPDFLDLPIIEVSATKLLPSVPFCKPPCFFFQGERQLALCRAAAASRVR